MLGKHHVLIENAYIRYEFEISRNITVIRGLSGTGKTTLVDMIRAYSEQEDNGVQIQCDKELTVLYGRDWKRQLDDITDSIVFIDEQSRFSKSKEFAEAIKGTDNYYVIVTREKLSELPYSITEIYGIRTSGKYAGLAGEYTKNEFFRIYGNTPTKYFKPDIIITEDTNSGHDFWAKVSRNTTCIAANGKADVINKLQQVSSSDNKCLVIVDGAAFGPEMEQVMQYIRFANSSVELYAPESFEYLLLSSGLFPSGDVTDKCRNTADYADSTKYMSWEQFYTGLIAELTTGSEMHYSKKKLNLYYLSDRNTEIILKEIPDRLLIGE